MRSHHARAVAAKDSEITEKSGVLGFTDAISPARLSSSDPSSLCLPGRFRSRAAVEPENLALRHQPRVLRRQRPGRHFDEDLLGCVLGILGMVEHADCNVVDPPLMALN